MAGVREYSPSWRVALFATVLFLAGCVSVEHTTTPTTQTASAATTVCDRLYFGRSIPGGGEVSEAQWDQFVAEVVVPRFPEGFTVFRGDGNWKGDNGLVVSEHTSVLEITHAPGPAAAAKVAEIGQTYRDRFHQEAVLLISTPATMTLWRR